MDLNLVEGAFRTYIDIVQGVTQEEIKLLVEQEATCNQALDDFNHARIDEETFLDILEANGHTMDTYVYTVNDNLDYLGL